jgi:DNA-binding FadR family transcriptional regulator
MPNPAPVPNIANGSDGLFAYLKASILKEEIQFDERLASERDLAQKFGIARGTVRVALQRLEKAHLVRVKTGSGTFVIHNPEFQNANIAHSTSPLELIQTRLAVEPYIAKLVVANASQRDIDRLEDAVTQLERHSGNPDAFSVADEAYHLLLAQCSKNQLLLWMYQRINDIRSHNQWRETKKNILTTDNIHHYNIQHRALLSCIKRRDAVSAMTVMREHLQKARHDLEGQDV